ncbi:MAG: hypothetical protein AB1485_07225 [Candidatus Thermoplasmatota archaeon]
MSINWIYIEVPYDDALLPKDVKEGNLRLYYWNETSSKWESCAKIGRTSVDPDRNIVWANVTHLTILAPMAEKVAEVAPVNWLLYIGIPVIIVIVAVSFAIVARTKRKRVESEK